MMTASQRWWRRCLRRAGLPDWLPPRAIGARQLKAAEHLQDEDPETWAALVSAHRQSVAEFNARLVTAGCKPINPVV
jgi:hypothetical protein